MPKAPVSPHIGVLVVDDQYIVRRGIISTLADIPGMRCIGEAACGEEAITLLPDLDAGATGSMTGGGYPDGIRRIVDAYAAGRRDDAIAEYTRWLPLINFENRQGGILSAKALMMAGGVIACEASRHPFPAMQPAVRTGLLETARRLDPLVLRWGR